MKKFLKLSVFAFLLYCLLYPKTSRADAFVVHLFYDSAAQNLRFDTFSTDKVSFDKTLVIGIQEFSQNNTPGKFVLKLYDSNGIELINHEFTPQKGAFSLSLPYFSLATDLKIFDKVSQKEILNASLSQFTTCNGNMLCEFEKGETAQNCLGDCASSPVVYSESTQKLLQENSGVIKDKTTGKILLQGSAQAPSTANKAQPVPTTSSVFPLVMGIILVILLAVGGFLLYRKFFKQQK